ncbi:MAG: rpfC, partial [Myxococcaceae bacterium]|nr:rpfC [Myxococcaceae bacterium]
VVEAALETVRPAADAKSVQLAVVSAADAVLTGDPHRLHQVLWNLLSNAVKFTPGGGRVEVIVAARESTIDVTVADTGRGIDPGFLAHVFERFRQADGTSTRTCGGLGLGLSIVRHIVELHGGTVEVASEGEGRGSRFTVSLPRKAAAHPAEVSSAPERALRPSGEPRPLPALDGVHVVVVDDHEDIREWLRALLEEVGARVRVAGSAAEALRLVEAEHPAMLVADIGLPGEDGYALVEKLRALPSGMGGAIPAVALTAYTRGTDRDRALQAGFTCHIAKPVDPVELVSVVARLSGRAPSVPMPGDK